MMEVSEQAPHHPCFEQTIVLDTNNASSTDLS